MCCMQRIRKRHDLIAHGETLTPSFGNALNPVVGARLLRQLAADCTADTR